MVFDQLRGFDNSRPVYVEAESPRIGRLNVPLPLRRAPLIGFFQWWREWWHRIWCWIKRILGRAQCDRVHTREVDEARTETISNAPAGSEAWNGTYSWRARFTLHVDERSCTATVASATSGASSRSFPGLVTAEECEPR